MKKSELDAMNAILAYASGACMFVSQKHIDVAQTALNRLSNADRKTIPPPMAACETYGASINMKPDQIESFYDHFESNGWKVSGKSPMKCWKSAMRNWKKNSINFSNDSREEAFSERQDNARKLSQARVAASRAEENENIATAEERAAALARMRTNLKKGRK